MRCKHEDVIKWKHFSRYWPCVRGIHRSPVNSPHKGQWRGALMFSLICAQINGWVNNRDAGDLRRHRAYYEVIIMICVDGRAHRRFWRWQAPFSVLCHYLTNCASTRRHQIFVGLRSGIIRDWSLRGGAIFHDDVIKWKHFPPYWPSGRGIYRSSGDSPNKQSLWRGAVMFSMMCAWTNSWANSWDADELRR